MTHSFETSPGPGRARPARRAAILCGLVAAAALAGYALRYRSVTGFVTAIDHCEYLFCDFREIYYPMGEGIGPSATPARGFFYSPAFALAVGAIARAPLPVALWIWGLLQVAALILLWVFPVRAFLRVSPALVVGYTAAYVTSFPLLHNFKWGQVSVMLTLAVIVAMTWHAEGKWRGATVALATAAAVKPYPALFALGFVARRDWRALGAWTGGVLVLALILPALVLGPRSTWDFYRQLGEQMQAFLVTVPPSDVNSQYVAHVIPRALGLRPSPTGALTVALQLAGLGVAALAAGLLWRRLRAGAADGARWTLALLFPCLPFLLHTSWPHYFVYLPLVQAFLAQQLLRAAPRRHRCARWGRWAAWTALALSALLASVLCFELVGSWQTYGRRGLLFVANLLVLGVAVSLARNLEAPTGVPDQEDGGRAHSAGEVQRLRSSNS